MKEYNLKPLHKTLIGIYNDFKTFCLENGLVHYVAFCTLLGAVRHGGFVPWDDDFDVYMPRPDYERLIKNRDLLPDYLKLRTIGTDCDHRLLFAKLVDCRAGRKEVLMRQTNLSLTQGIFIDIFPLDGIPSNSILLFLWRVQRSVRRRFQTAFKLENWFKSYKFESCKYVGLANSDQSDPSRYRYDKCFFGVPKSIRFEDITCLAPSDPESVLTVDYGNWRELPAKEKRVPTHSVLG